MMALNSRSTRLVRCSRLAIYLLIGASARILPVARNSYPLGEGGLFHYVIQSIAQTGDLPAEIPFFSGGIPFSYPPLGFVIYAYLHSLGHIELFDVFRWAPVALSLGSLLLFALFSREFLHGLSWEAAVLCFATIPSVALRVTASDAIRNLAFCFSLIGLYALTRALSSKSRVWCLVAGIGFGLTAVSHPGIAFGSAIVAAGLVLFHAVSRRSSQAILVGQFALLVCGLVVLPWVRWLYLTHGSSVIGQLLGALSSRPYKSIWALTLLRLGASGEPFGQVWAVSSMLGALYSLVAGTPLLALWLVITPLQWYGPIHATPLALCAGITVGEVVAPRLRAPRRPSQHLSDTCLLGLLAVYGAIGSFVFSVMPEDGLLGRTFGCHGLQSQITSERLSAWEWMSDNLSESAWVVLVAEEREWVPAFGQVNANLSQGAEWIGQFQEHGQLYNELEGVASYEGLTRALEAHSQPMDYLYLTNSPSQQFLERVALRGGSVHGLAQDMSAVDCALRLYNNAAVILYNVRNCE